MDGAVLGALARRGEAVAAAERGYSGAPWRTAGAAFGTAAAPSAAVLRMRLLFRAVGYPQTSSPARSGAGSAASPSSLYCKAPCRRLSVSGTVRSGVLGAALACFAPWGCERGWCGAQGTGTARGGSGSSREGVLLSTMVGGWCSLRDGCSAVGGGAARVLREYSPMRGSTGGKRAARPRAWWVL